MTKDILTGYRLRRELTHWETPFLIVLKTTVPIDRLRSQLSKFDIGLTNPEEMDKADHHRVTLEVMEVESLSAEQRLDVVFALLAEFGIAEEISRKRLGKKNCPKRERVQVETEIGEKVEESAGVSELKGKFGAAWESYVLFCEQSRFEALILRERFKLCTKELEQSTVAK